MSPWFVSDNMNQKHIVFKHIDPPEHLLGEIFNKIGDKKKKAARINLFLSSLGAIASLGVFVFAFDYALGVFYYSGAFSYLSILLSDPSVALSSGVELSLSIVESLPILETAVLLFATLAFLGSFKYAIENVSNLSLKNRLA
jgi:hypothetical protein